MRQVEWERQWEKRMVRVGEFIATLGEDTLPKGLDGARLDAVTVKWEQPDRTNVLVVVKASTEDEKWVAFVGALTLMDAVLTWRSKEGGQGLRWREDRPWRPSQGDTGK